MYASECVCVCLILVYNVGEKNIMNEQSYEVLVGGYLRGCTLQLCWDTTLRLCVQS